MRQIEKLVEECSKSIKILRDIPEELGAATDGLKDGYMEFDECIEMIEYSTKEMEEHVNNIMVNVEDSLNDFMELSLLFD